MVPPCNKGGPQCRNCPGMAPNPPRCMMRGRCARIYPHLLRHLTNRQPLSGENGAGGVGGIFITNDEENRTRKRFQRECSRWDPSDTWEPGDLKSWIHYGVSIVKHAQVTLNGSKSSESSYRCEKLRQTVMARSNLSEFVLQCKRRADPQFDNYSGEHVS